MDEQDVIWVDCEECGRAVDLCPDDAAYHAGGSVLCMDCVWGLKDDPDDDEY